jgi:small subunit ribosomal protein S17e
MGRIRTKLIKGISSQLYKKHAQHFSKDFEQNKKLVDRLAIISSKKMRNTIAGSITRKMNVEE